MLKSTLVDRTNCCGLTANLPVRHLHELRGWWTLYCDGWSGYQLMRPPGYSRPKQFLLRKSFSYNSVWPLSVFVFFCRLPVFGFCFVLISISGSLFFVLFLLFVLLKWSTFWFCFLFFVLFWFCFCSYFVFVFSLFLTCISGSLCFCYCFVLVEIKLFVCFCHFYCRSMPLVFPPLCLDPQ